MKLGSLCVALLTELAKIKSHPLHILETGCIRDLVCTDEGEEGRSTLRIAQWKRLENRDDVFNSVDSSKESIDICRKVLEDAGLFVRDESRMWVGLWNMDSVEYLKALSLSDWLCDFVLLDSDSDPRVIKNEFDLLRMAQNSIVLIDDVYTNDGVNKGELVLQGCVQFHCRLWRCEAIAFGLDAEKIVRWIALNQ